MLKEIIEQAVKDILMAETKTEKPKQVTEHDFIGKSVLIRAHLMGVQIGVVTGVDDKFIRLTKSRKLWRWEAKQSIALESLAAHGAVESGTKATAIVNFVAVPISDICGIIELSGAVFANLLNLPEHEQE